MATATYTPYTNIGPLTTEFTAPSSCGLLSLQILSGVTFIENYRFDWPSAADCYPPGYPLEYNNLDFYSPGVCPSGWAIYRNPNYDSTTETTEMCCPGKWELTGLHCTWSVTAVTTTTAVIINGEISPDRSYGDNTAGLSTSTGFVMYPTTAVIQAIEVRYRAEDFGGSISKTQTVNPSDHGSWSTGATIGIGISLPLLALIMVVFLRIRRPRRGQCVSYDGDTRDSHAEYEEHRAEPGGYRFCVSAGGKYASNPEDIEQHDAMGLPPPPYQSKEPSDLEITAVATPLGETHLPTSNAHEAGRVVSVQESFRSEVVLGATSQDLPPTTTELLPAALGALQAAAEDKEEGEEELQYRERRLRERRELLLAEKERLVHEEDELRQLRVKTKAGPSKPGSGIV